ncbi:aminotransferase GliI [Massariosphaeria phaeospora]|uniref:Aminotransferase GliI n=1 Tax=Massariosphaeria phaeospora TaxID=100035 RepID=A0A7C8MHY6_9PLEO|nr:aminotransferase GliI [Massariosphaeria phaeospora]
MLSRRCRVRNEVIIPRLMGQHGPNRTDSALIDLRTADNWFIKRFISHSSLHNKQEAISENDLAYSQDVGGCYQLRAILTSLFKAHVCPGLAIDPSPVVLGAGGSYILDALIEVTCDEGDLVMVATPYWSGLDLCISVHNSAAVLPVHIPLHHFFSLESVSYHLKALQDSTLLVKAVLICNPHNPLGGCYPLETLKAMATFCYDHNLHLISDEVYALSLHRETTGAKHTIVSALQMLPLPFLHVVYSVSKDFGCNGIRLGALMSLNQAVCMSVALSTHSQLSSVTTRFAIDVVLQPRTIHLVLSGNRVYLERNYSTVAQFLKRKHVEFYSACAGFFLFAKLCSEDEKGFDTRLRQCGVALATGTEYHFTEIGWFRICFAIPPWKLSQACGKIESALDSNEQEGTEVVNKDRL